MPHSADNHLPKAAPWHGVINALRTIAMQTPLQETTKWGKPCYTHENNNIVLIQPFKYYCALLFFQGALLRDPEHILIRPGTHTQASRQLRFTSVQEVTDRAAIIKAYIEEAIATGNSGQRITLKPLEAYPVPDELQTYFETNRALKEAFEALTPGRKKAYLIYFAAPKQSQTKISRIEQYKNKIMNGKGMRD